MSIYSNITHNTLEFPTIYSNITHDTWEFPTIDSNITHNPWEFPTIRTYLQVAADERKGAELDYLKKMGPEWLKCGGSQDSNKNKPSQEFTNIHPRFASLVKSMLSID